jgi:hypothetical protein
MNREADTYSTRGGRRGEGEGEEGGGAEERRMGARGGLWAREERACIGPSPRLVASSAFLDASALSRNSAVIVGASMTLNAV